MSVEYRPGRVPEEAVDYLRKKRVSEELLSWDYRGVWREEHGLGFTVANMMTVDLTRDVRDSFVSALTEGTTFEEWKKHWAEELSKRGWWGRLDPPDPDDPEAVARADLYVSRRLDTIWRVNTRQAYQAGVWERGQRSTSHPWVLYLLGPSREHRDQHRAWAGIILPKDDPWWSVANPSNGWGCKCTTRFVSRAQRDRYLRRGIPIAPTTSRRRHGSRSEGRRGRTNTASWSPPTSSAI